MKVSRVKLVRTSKESSSRVLKNMFTLLLGTAGAKIVGLAVMPLLTRIYTPEDYGALSLFTSAVLLLSPLLTLRYVYAIPLPRNDKVSLILVFMSITLATSLSVLIVFFMIFLEKLIAIFFNLDGLLNYWPLIVVGAYGMSLYEIMTLWAIRKSKYREISKSGFMQSAAGGGIKVILGACGIGYLGLMLGQIVQQGGGILILARDFVSSWRVYEPKISVNKLCLLVKYYSDLPKYRLATQLLVVLSSQMPILYVSTSFGLGAAGQLGLALMALSFPVQLIGNTMGKSFLGEISKVGEKNKSLIRSIMTRIIIRMAILGSVGSLLAYHAAPAVFELVFGDRWLEAGHIAKYLSLYLACQFCYTSVGGVFIVVKKNGVQLINQIIRMAMILLSFAIAGLMGYGLFESILLYSAFLGLSYILGVINLYSVLRPGGEVK